AKFGSMAIPFIPASFADRRSPGVTMLLIVPFGRRTCTGPGRCVKNMVPSGRNAMSHGFVSPVTKFVSVVSVGESAGGSRSGGGGGSGGCCGAGGGLTGAHAATIDPTHITASAAPAKRRPLTVLPLPASVASTVVARL